MLSENICYVGVNDHEIDLFEGQYDVPNGMAYNSYVILDDNICVMDSVDARFTQTWFDRIDAVCDGRKPDYLVVQHMEPDHSGSILHFAQQYPEAMIVASAKAFAMMQQFFGTDFAQRRMVVKEGSTLPLGLHTLQFFTAPMVHWPEVIMSYEQHEKLFFSADAFGKFGALDVQEDWACEARRYYFGIVGKYGAQVQQLLKKIAPLEISAVCPLHGPVLQDSLPECLALYDAWSAYRPESSGVVIAYTSIYGHTRAAVEKLADALRARGEKVVVNDLARCDMFEAVEDAFRYDRLVLASTTYNNGVFPFMQTFLHHLSERNYQSRTVGLIENGSWAPNAAKVMKSLLEDCKNLTLLPCEVRILSALQADSEAQLDALCNALTQQ